jgi:transcriptional regulator with XRE-family HTH domain
MTTETTKAPSNRIREIRIMMGMTQVQFAQMLGMTQGNVGHYENKDQAVPPDVARRLILEARSRGHVLSFSDVYGEVQ